MCSTVGKAFEMANEVIGIAKGDRRRRVDVDQLLHVEDLDTMADRLATDDHQVVLATDLAPRAGRRVGG